MTNHFELGLRLRLLIAFLGPICDYLRHGGFIRNHQSLRFGETALYVTLEINKEDM